MECTRKPRNLQSRDVHFRVRSAKIVAPDYPAPEGRNQARAFRREVMEVPTEGLEKGQHTIGKRAPRKSRPGLHTALVSPRFLRPGSFFFELTNAFPRLRIGLKRQDYGSNQDHKSHRVGGPYEHGRTAHREESRHC